MEYYTWRVRGKPVEVRLSLPMLRFMAPWINERAARQPEMFGMLLGRTRRGWGRTVAVVDDFEPFDPASLRGAPKPPHGTELKVVGLYHRREGEELKLDQLDASLIQTSFVHPGMVYLLLAVAHDRPDRAAFFIQERGEVHGYSSYAEFPFDAALLQRSPAASTGSRLRRWLPVSGLAASLLALGGWFLWLRRSAPPVAPAAVVAPQTQAPQPAVAPAPDAPKPATPARARDRRTKKRKPAPTHRKRHR